MEREPRAALEKLCRNWMVSFCLVFHCDDIEQQPSLERDWTAGLKSWHSVISTNCAPHGKQLREGTRRRLFNG